MAHRSPATVTSRPPGSGAFALSGAIPTEPTRMAVPPNDHGLVGYVRATYLAPGGDYARAQFFHAEGCLNGSVEFDESVRAVMSRLNVRTLDLVENSCAAVLADRGALLDADSTV